MENGNSKLVTMNDPTEERALREGWKNARKELPPSCINVLLAFEDHWNQVVGFYGGDAWWETSAHDLNSKIEGAPPRWWHQIPAVPHRLHD